MGLPVDVSVDVQLLPGGTQIGRFSKGALK